MRIVLAMGQMTAVLGEVGFALCLLMVGFGIFSPRSRQHTSQSTIDLAKLHATIAGILALGAVGLWLTTTLPLLGWLLFFGDNWNPPGVVYAVIAGSLSVAYAIVLFIRIASGRMARLHAKVCCWWSVGVLILLSIIWMVEFVDPIEGTSPESAAQSILQWMGCPSGSRLVEDQRINPDYPDRERSKTFWIMGETEPVGRIVVSRYGSFWWSHSGSHKWEPSKENLERAKELLQSPWNRDTATFSLREIVWNYPGTEAAKEAAELLNRLESSGTMR